MRVNYESLGTQLYAQHFEQHVYVAVFNWKQNQLLTTETLPRNHIGQNVMHVNVP